MILHVKCMPRNIEFRAAKQSSVTGLIFIAEIVYTLNNLQPYAVSPSARVHIYVPLKVIASTYIIRNYTNIFGQKTVKTRA